MNKILLITAHPALEKSRNNIRLMKAADSIDHVVVRDLYELYPRFFIDTAKEHNLKYILFEQNISSKIAETVQKETGTESLTLHNLEAVTKQEIESNEDYFSLMRQNLDTLKKALN